MVKSGFIDSHYGWLLLFLENIFFQQSLIFFKSNPYAFHSRQAFDIDEQNCSIDSSFKYILSLIF